MSLLFLMFFSSYWLLQAPASSANKNLDFLFAGYAVVWLLLLGYLFSLGRRQKRLESEIEMLKQMKQEG
jgi:CcmD family protein